MKVLVFVLLAIAVILSVHIYKEKTRNSISVHPIKKILFEKKPDLRLWFIKTGDFNKINEVLKKRMLTHDEQLAKDAISLDEYRKLYNKIYEQIIEETKSSYRFEYGLSALGRLKDNYANPVIFFASPNRISEEERKIIATFGKDSGKVLLSENINQEIVALENIMGPTDDHPSARGYTILAHDIFDCLVSSSFLKCN